MAYRDIRRKILNGDIAPGEKLRVEILQRATTLSSSPIREALNRLVTEKLVIADDHRGFRAAPMSVADLMDITNFRLTIEPAALAQSIASGNDEWEGRVVAAFHRMEKARDRVARSDPDFNEEWSSRHREFHMALLSAADSARLVATCQSLFDQAERYRRFSSMNRTRPRDTGSEHRRLMDAALGRQADAALELQRLHITRTTENTLAIWQERGQVAAG
ncbi:MAG TPA: FCD domain-containing protein [Stellaceae bacterium]|nr:FCD domain-containing protein [Stellaceae bacterium]